MGQGLRASMGWLHTWGGVVIGALLFVIFWMGTLTVFWAEIDRWMMPETRLALPQTPLSWDTVWREHPPAAGAASWSATMPTVRTPMLVVTSRPAPAGEVSRRFDATSGARLPARRSRAGGGFIYPFHVDLHVEPQLLGYWIVGVAGMAMLVLCLSGVIIHRRLFADFFLLRPAARAGRLSLDLHVIAGVLALPFHIAITFSGMVVFLSVFFFPQIVKVAYQGDRPAFTREWLNNYTRPAAGRTRVGELASLDAMAGEARRTWGGSPPSSLVVQHPGDANAYVTVSRPSADSVTRPLESMHFDASTGQLLHRQVMKPSVRVYQFLAGMHLMRFDNWTALWLCFTLGLSGCLMIFTGYLFWMESRRRAHEQQGMAGVRIVEGLTMGSTTGIIAATMTFFVVNRLMPGGPTVLGAEPAALEVRAFYVVWVMAFAHAWLRGGKGWAEQCGIIAVLAAAAAALNAMTTGDHLVRTISNGMWAVAGMDLMLLLCAALGMTTAVKLRARQVVQRASAPEPSPTAALGSSVLEATSLAGVVVTNTLGWALFALAQDRHWRTVTARPVCPAPYRIVARVMGSGLLVVSLALLLWREGPGFGAIIWSATLSVGAFVVVGMLGWRAHWLRPLTRVPSHGLDVSAAASTRRQPRTR